jgi:aryl-alcohol dehydrogenase-like predicted oxidoreductase
MPTTPVRKLGNSDITVRPLCLGGNVFGWTIDEPTSFQILDAFLTAGFSFIDTASGSPATPVANRKPSSATG